MFSFLFALSLLPAADAPAPVAMVLRTRGPVTRELAGGKQPLGPMALLWLDDRLTIDDQGEAEVAFLADGHHERLKAGDRIEVGVKGCSPAEASERVEGVRLSDQNLTTLRQLVPSGSAAVATARPLEVVPLEDVPRYPMAGSKVLTDRPEFEWPELPEAESYQVTLLSGTEGPGERELWRAATKMSPLDYPEQEKPLQPGQPYRWRVVARLPDGRLVPQVNNSKFLSATRDEMEALAGLAELKSSRNPARQLQAAVVYAAYGIDDVALNLYEKLATKLPEEASLQRALADYYERAGCKGKARKARARAEQLEKAVPEKREAP